MSENPSRGRQTRNFTTNVPKILDLKSSSEQIFFRKLSLGVPVLYVTDLPEVISSSSRVLMFTDDTKIFREIKTLGDASSLQEDLGKLATWSQSSGLLFNEAKCKAQHITRKTKPI